MTQPRRIVITGVSRGLGRALVDGFIERGHVVVGCARSAEAIEEMRRRYGSPHRFDAVDVGDENAVERWAGEVLGEGETPDLLINNAAVINRGAVLWEVPSAEFARLMEVNVNGTFHVIRHFVPAMVALRRGVIVNMSSGWGRGVSPEVAPYCASKWAIEGLTRALAEELPRGMAAVPVNPGIIDTEMLRISFGSSAASYPSAVTWAKQAVPFLLGLGPAENGRPLTVPGARE